MKSDVRYQVSKSDFGQTYVYNISINFSLFCLKIIIEARFSADLSNLIEALTWPSKTNEFLRKFWL